MLGEEGGTSMLANRLARDENTLVFLLFGFVGVPQNNYNIVKYNITNKCFIISPHTIHQFGIINIVIKYILPCVYFSLCI